MDMNLRASAIVVGVGVLWGLYWLPVRAVERLGFTGAWGTAAICCGAVLILLPVAVARRRAFLTDAVALASIAIGGAAFALYSVGLVHGRVAIIILLFYLTPVWSVLIGRYVMGWRSSRLRIAAILVGLAGLIVMLGADGEWPLPRGVGEWIALAAGFLWAVSTTGIRTRSTLAPAPATFVFALGAAAASLALAPALSPLPDVAVDAVTVGSALAVGGIWWGLSIAALLWATVRLDPARVGILLMSEVLVGALSAAWLAGEHLAPLELFGGALVLGAGLLEVWPVRRRGGASGPTEGAP